METLAGKTLFITGASRGIGKAIGLRAAKDGANIVIASKTDQTNPKLPGTIHTAAREMEAAGGQTLPLVVDIRFEDQIEEAVQKTLETFGGIDILVNNASAIQLSGTLETPMKRFDLMHQVNARGTFAASRACLPHLKKAENPHILTLSPPLDMKPAWFAGHTAYTMAKFGMSMVVLGLAEEFKAEGIAINALWPRTMIATSAVRNILGGDDTIKHCRKPGIMADAAHAILTRDSRETTGNFFIDDEVLAEAGITDLEKYAVDPEESLYPDLFTYCSYCKF
jgi:citronellol/citronellal dehydrogenase